jgi:sugar lactone lactonase YvrE
MSRIEHILPCQNQLGEGPVWSVEEQALYWVDIVGKSYARYYPETGKHEVVNVGIEIGVLAQRANGGLVMATRDGLAFWDEEKRELEYIARPHGNKPFMRFNDGAVDSAGRFWAGSMSEKTPPEDGTLYRLDLDGTVHEMEFGVGCSNGIDWSPNDKIMYYTDSEKRHIYAYDFDAATGAISNRRIFVDTSAEAGAPDGLAVDSEGYIWSARWDGAKVVRYAPDGTIDRVIEVPVLQPSSCAFGGKDLDELYITSAAEGKGIRVKYPLSGDLFRVKTGVRGRLPHKFGA